MFCKVIPVYFGDRFKVKGIFLNDYHDKLKLFWSGYKLDINWLVSCKSCMDILKKNKKYMSYLRKSAYHFPELKHKVWFLCRVCLNNLFQVPLNCQNIRQAAGPEHIPHHNSGSSHIFKKKPRALCSFPPPSGVRAVTPSVSESPSLQTSPQISFCPRINTSSGSESSVINLTQSPQTTGSIRSAQFIQSRLAKPVLVV